ASKLPFCCSSHSAPMRVGAPPAPAMRFVLRSAAALLLTSLPFASAAAQAKPLVTPKDLGKWESLGAFRLAPHGTWLATTIARDDNVVDMRQGVEFWNYARRAGKDAVMLLYPGEGHGLAKRENAIDYERRILQWFAHYLK